jgi:hypothetical protein
MSGSAAACTARITAPCAWTPPSVAVALAVSDGVAIRVAVNVAEGVGCTVGVAVGVGVGTSVAVAVGANVGLSVSVGSMGVLVGASVAV